MRTRANLLCITLSSVAISGRPATLFWDVHRAAGCGGLAYWGHRALPVDFWGTACDSGLGLWTDGSDANFSGTAATVTLTNAVSAGTLTFPLTGYTLAGTPVLTLNSVVANYSSGLTTLSCNYTGS